MDGKQAEEFKRPLAKAGTMKLPLSGIESNSSSSVSSSSHSDVVMRHSLSRSDATFGRTGGQSAGGGGGGAGGKGVAGSGSPVKARSLAKTVSNVYSPRWILNVKRESDKQVRAFLETLAQPEARVSVGSEVLAGLEEEGNKFLRFKTDGLGPSSKTMVNRLQLLLSRASTSKEKQLVVQLLLVISSCSRLDEYIACVREAENAATYKQPELVGRSGYDGQMEYRKMDSPRLRDSATKRANFLSMSLGQDEMDAYIDLTPSLSGSPGSQDDEKVLCRICENYIPKNIYASHAIFCGRKGEMIHYCFGCVC